MPTVEALSLRESEVGSVGTLEPLLRLVPSPVPIPFLRASSERWTLIQRSLVASGGVVPMGCGCFMKVDPTALGTLTTEVIVDAICQSVGTCKHPPTIH